MRKPRHKDIIVPLLLVAPMLLRWIMPSGLENLFYLRIADIVIWLPDFSYLLYFLFYNKLHIKFRFPRQSFINIVLALLFLYAILLLIVSPVSASDKLNILISNFSFIYLPWLFVNYPLDKEHIHYLKWPFVIALLFVGLQVILYGTGILEYTTATGEDLTDSKYEMSGVYRIPTTVGAATGTGVLLVILGIFVMSCYSFSKWLFPLLFIVNTVAIFFTISRGPIISWLFFIFYYFIWNFTQRSSWTKRLLYLFSLLLFAYAIDYYGILNPVKDRIENKVGDITSGRLEFNYEAIRLADDSDYIGVGPGLVFPEKSLASRIDIPYYIRMHNTFLVYLAELGILGLFLYIILYFALFFKIKIKETFIALPILVILLVNYNTEALFVWNEYLSLMMLVFVFAHQSSYHSYNSTIQNRNL